MIENLENNEQILLMYLAGELPPEDHVAIERLLAADASLRRQCQELQSLQVAVGDGLGRLDELSMPVSADFAVRQVGRAIRQKLARPKVVPAAAVSDGPPRSWWWLYPTVAAASIAIVAMVWLNRQASEPVVMHPSSSQVLPDTSPSVAEAPSNTGESDDALLLESLSPSGSDRQEAHAVDDEARQQVASGDGMPQDEISQYLLSATATEQ